LAFITSFEVTKVPLEFVTTVVGAEIGGIVVAEGAPVAPVKPWPGWLLALFISHCIVGTKYDEEPL